MTDEVKRAPDWAWEEIVLACDLVVQNGWKQLTEDNPKIAELSGLLQKMDIHPPEVRGGKFRNVNGVVRKTADIATARPDYQGGRTKGGHRTEAVVAEFVARPDVMHAAAASLRSSLLAGEVPAVPLEVGYEDESELEGRLFLRLHAYRERKPGLKKKKIKSVLASGGILACQACEFDFGKFYGERGQGYIECHHIEPLHMGGEKRRGLDDLALLCANCHRVIHKQLPWPTPTELRELILNQTK
jgi:5-methylcytosine-specific restriction protein A